MSASRTNQAAVFDLCPLFLLLVLGTLGIAWVESVLNGVASPFKASSVSALVLSLAIFGVPFAAAAKPASPRDWGNIIAACLILPIGNMIMPWANDQTIRTLPNVFDSQVVALDATLGFQPSFAVGVLFSRYPAFAAICSAMYGAVLFPAALVACVEALQGRRRGIGALPTFLVIAGLGFPIYHLLPAIGPAAWFGAAFPFGTEFSHPPFPRNAIPSLHTAWVVMAVLCTRGMSLPIRLTAGILAAGTIITTLGSGAHYLLDLVLAGPFVLLVRALCAVELPIMARERIGACLAGVGLLVAWGLAVRGIVDGTGVPGAVPAAMLATVVLSVWWERRLARGEAGFDAGLTPGG